jgi:nucleoside-diphosphate-sugar epimerase
VAWGGSAGYHHARDVAAAFIAAARACGDGGGSDTYTLPVQTRTMDEVVAAIEAAGGADVTYDPAPLPFPGAFDASVLERRLGGVRLTPFQDGVRETVETFRAAVRDGRLDADGLLARR